jgi:UDPglucose--hexose-1-phosphate uridylyltransferase
MSSGEAFLGIRFESTLRQARILSPLNNFEPVTQIIDHREDPLTRRRVLVLKQRMEYVKRFIETDDNFLNELIDSTASTCPFCPSSILSKSPKFTSDLLPEGRIQVGEAVCFPSLFAHEDFNAIVVPTRSHSLPLNQMEPSMFVDAFKACLLYFERVRFNSPEAKFATIIMNFLPPAGSTIGHSHLQALASDIPFQSIERQLEASKAYHDENRVSYWVDLVETEKRLGERYLGNTRNVDWLTPFAPTGLNEAQAIVKHKSSLDQLTSEDLEGLAEGLVRVMRCYHDAGVRSINAAIYSGPLGQILDHFAVNLRIVSRYGYKPRFVSDVWALQYLLGEQEVYASPEETASKLRSYFQL